jgi:hypothetical protein
MAKTTKKAAKKPAKKQPAKTTKKKGPTWTELNQSYGMLETLSNFLDDSVHYHKAPKYSKDLIKKITTEWATAAAKDSKQKHKATLIKSFGEFISSV